jgi:hypothetical protein
MSNNSIKEYSFTYQNYRDEHIKEQEKKDNNERVISILAQRV